jgi:apolipoprotein N-acyltransferase
VSDRLSAIARAVRIPLLVGTPVGEGDKIFNAALLIDPEGNILQEYRKVHLVPFGEYVPLGPVFSWLRKFVLMGDFSPGHEFTVFRPSSIAPFSVLICFEDLFPYLSRRFIREGARWLIVITNDAWFGRSAASLQHLQASVFRAIEGRVWVVRAANTGWSGFIDPAGRRRPFPSQVPRFEPGVAIAEIVSF